MANDDDLARRLDLVERTLASVTADHTGHLLALQAVAAVLTVRLTAASNDPGKVLADCRTWAHNVVDATNAAPTLSDETAEKMRTIAREKIDLFFSGIHIRRPD